MNAPEKNLRICVAPGVYRAEDDSAPRNLADTIRRRFRPLGGVDLRVPVREPMREPMHEPPKPGKRAGK